MDRQDTQRDRATGGRAGPGLLIALLVVLAVAAAVAALSTPTWWPVVIAVAVAIAVVVVVAWHLGAASTEPAALLVTASDDAPGTDLIAAVSHDLRTPLATIGAYVELLEAGDAGELSVDQRQLLGVVEENVQRAYALADDLVDLRIADSAVLENIRISDVVRRAVRAVEPSARARNLTVTLEDDLEGARVHGNAVALDRVLVNLLSNAVKFTPEGGTITIRGGVDAGSAVIDVADTGHGIPEHEQRRIFDRYYRAAAVRDGHVPGSGLGLAIVRELVTKLGGTVEVQSRPGDGATFTLRLPALAAAA